MHDYYYVNTPKSSVEGIKRKYYIFYTLNGVRNLLFTKMCAYDLNGLIILSCFVSNKLNYFEYGKFCEGTLSF